MHTGEKYSENDLLLLSGIQHFAFCRRQWALIHVEKVWVENILTAMGRQMHDTVHETGREFERRGELLITRSLPIKSLRLGLSGVCDVVEFIEDAEGISLNNIKGKYRVMPVEYKRGRKKLSDEDVVQVAAQAMCLEEMLCCQIKDLVIYYGSEKGRTTYALSDELRQRVEQLCKEMHELAERKYTPKVKYSKKCDACSLYDVCLPKAINTSVEKYLEQNLREVEE